jgi:hypothetical protein
MFCDGFFAPSEFIELALFPRWRFKSLLCLSSRRRAEVEVLVTHG